jgi:plastocyanin
MSVRVARLGRMGKAVVGLAVMAATTAALAPAASAFTAVGVTAREYRFGVYRASVAPGWVHFNVTNRGEDVHDLLVLSPRGYRVRLSPDIASGGRFTLVARMPGPGTYRLLCTKNDHAARGMRSSIVVRRRVVGR